MAGLLIRIFDRGEPTLEHAVNSVRSQMCSLDKLEVIPPEHLTKQSPTGEGASGPQESILSDTGTHLRACQIDEYAGSKASHYNYVFHLSAEAILAEGALACVRRAILQHPPSLFLFRSCLADGSLVWKEPQLHDTSVAKAPLVHSVLADSQVFAHETAIGPPAIADIARRHPKIPLLWHSAIIAHFRTGDEVRLPRAEGGIILRGRSYDLGGVGRGNGTVTVNLDGSADINADFTALDQFVPDDRTAKAFVLSHALEHVPSVKYVAFIRDLFRKLEPGGTVRVVQSDAQEAMRLWNNGRLSFRSLRSVLWTPPDRVRQNPYQMHHSMWSPEELARDFAAVGFKSKSFDAGCWTLDTTDELYPEDVRRNHGTAIRNLGVVATKPPDRVPNIIHFVFGMRPDFGGRPFGLVHYLAIHSAVAVNRPSRVILWYCYEPEGEWWMKAKALVEMIKVEDCATFQGIPRDHYAHRADIVRLLALREHGGIYLDLDTVCVKPFGDLRQHPCVMGWENEASSHLSNAVILAEPGAAFVNKLLESQAEFRPGMWADIAVAKSGQLARVHPDLLYALDSRAFCWPSWGAGGFELMHIDSKTQFTGAICHHLWEHLHWDRGLRDLSLEQLKGGTNNFSRIVRRFVDSL